MPVVDVETQLVLGVHMICPDAAEIGHGDGAQVRRDEAAVRPDGGTPPLHRRGVLHHARADPPCWAQRLRQPEAQTVTALIHMRSVDDLDGSRVKYQSSRYLTKTSRLQVAFTES